MASKQDYIAGLITLTNGSPNFTGTGTGWAAASVGIGDTIFDLPGTPYQGVINTITNDFAGTLTRNWDGPDLAGVPYRIRFQPDGSRYPAAVVQLIEELENGNLQAFAQLLGFANGVAVFTGPGAMEVQPKSAFVSGADYDVQVNTMAARAAYDGQATGFAVLVANVGTTFGAENDGRSAIFSKNSNTTGDWSDPAFVTGGIGLTPDVDATVAMLPPGSTPTVTPVPISGGVRLDFELPEASGFNPSGTYNAANAYNQDDVVLHNRSSFIAIQAVPIGESPSGAYPPVDTAYWQVLVVAGANGAGTVSDITGGVGISVDGTDPANPVISVQSAALVYFPTNRTTMAALDAAISNAWFDGRMWVLANVADYTALIAADTARGITVVSTVDATKVWVHKVKDALWSEWFGLAESNTGAQNDTAVAAMWAVGAVLGIVKFNTGPGTFLKASMQAVPVNGIMDHAGHSTESGSEGATVWVKDFNGGYLWNIRAGVTFKNCDLQCAPGRTGAPYAYSGGRNLVTSVLSKGFTAPFKVGLNIADNCNGWRNEKCYFVDGTGTGVANISQYRNATTYANGLTLVTGAEYFNTSTNTNWVVLAPGNGQVTSSGTLAADIAAHPTWWAVSSWPWGAPDVNDGFFLDFDIYNCVTTTVNDAIIFLGNAYDNKIVGRIQNKGGIGVVVEHGSRGQKGNIYLEKMPTYIHSTNTADLYWGAVDGNHFDLGMTNKYPVIQNLAGSIRNTWTWYFSDASGYGGAFSRVKVKDRNGYGHDIYETGRHDMRTPSGAQTALAIYSAGAYVGGLNTDGAGGIDLVETSDRRRKKNIRDLTGHWDRITKTQPREFEMDGVEKRGFIADEHANVYPSKVQGDPDAVDENGEPIYQTISTVSTEQIADIYAALKDIALWQESREPA